jgi:Mg-chelatase subunit ChlD
MTSATLRCLVVALLCVAWATPQWLGESARRLVVFVVDRSESCAADDAAARKFVDQAIAARGVNEAKFLSFAAVPGVVQSQLPSAATTFNAKDTPVPAAASTDIASAIALAQAVCPPDWVPQLVLLSDGRETTGQALAAAIAAKIPISTVPLTALAKPEVAIDRIEAPATAAPDEPIDIVITIAANGRQTVTVKLLRDNEPVAEKKLDVDAGHTTWRASTVLGPLAGAAFRAVVESASDTFAENNALAAIVLASEPARVLIVDSEPELAQPLRRALAAGGFQASVVNPQQVPDKAKLLEQNRLIVLSDISASALGAARTSAIISYVQAGGGLIAVGGDKAFGAAAFELTPLEKMLPIVATEQPVEQQKSLALVLVIDKSLSMLDEGRFGMAKEAARKVIGVLQPHDQAGVLAFGDESQWVSRLAPLARKEEVLQKIDQLEASGLTNMYPAMARAYLALSQADADSRHMIVLTDGVPTPGDFDEVAQRMAKAGITVSTVSLSQGADQTILKDIARVARGTHHHVNDPKELPQILERETRTAASKVTASQFTADAHRQLPGLDVASAPPLLGYVTTRYKPGAQLLLVAGEGDPLLTWWRYGRGVAMALTTDVKSRWGKQWHDWPGYNDFWRRLARHALQQEPTPPGTISIHEHAGVVSVTLDAATAKSNRAEFANGATATLNIKPQSTRGAERGAQSLPMPQVAPGRYSVSFDAHPAEPLMLEVSLQSGQTTLFQQSRGWVTRYADEFRVAPADVEKLKTIAASTGGKFQPDPPSVFAPDGRTVRIVHPLWPYVLMAALVVFVIDVAACRTRAQKLALIRQERKAA